MQAGRQKQQVNNGPMITAPEEAIVGPSHVAQVVSRWTKIPLARLDQVDKEKLTRLAKKLHERVVGQDEAVSLVAQAVLRSRVGLGQSSQQLSSFLFLGPHGVGKTQLAKALADKIFDSDKMLIRFDMSEYADTGSASRLIGGPPSYEEEEEGQLTEKVKRCPHSVILFDQVDKASPSVFKIFTQLLDDGVLADGKGRVVDFKNTIIIMTSSLGSEYLPSRMTKENTIKAARPLLMKLVQKRLEPALIERLSEVVIFEPLSCGELKEIVRIHMKIVVSTIANKGASLLVSDAALDVIRSESYNPVSKTSKMTIDATDNKRGLKYQVLEKHEVDVDIIHEC